MRILFGLLVAGIVLIAGCGGDNTVNWRVPNSPCYSDFKDNPAAVDSLATEMRRVPKEDRDQYADELDADASLNEENQLLASAALLRCKAWLLRHQ